ncbi:MAG: hypothetical protein KW793_02075 [Candidatus Doudnabacteria bacterium]|nr:hypothetical protein [Candidatus Doudnabacteria bacterium]
MTKIRNKTEQQKGVAILLAVLLISAITVISTTIAFFLIQEVKSNRATYMTEPAIVAAESAAEQGIYQIKRGTAVSSCDSNPTFGNVDPANNKVKYRNCLIASKATFQIDQSKDLVLYLYDPTNINGNLCMETTSSCPLDGNGSGTQLFTSLNIQHVTGGLVTATLESLDGLYSTTQLVSIGSKAIIPIARNLPNAEDERLKVTISTGSIATIDVDAGMAGNLGVYQGLPSYATIDAEACSAFNVTPTTCDTAGEIYTRRINVTLPQ